MKNDCRRDEPFAENMDVHIETRCTAESSCCLEHRCRFKEYDAVWLSDFEQEIEPWRA